jgi:hypothetical protein
VGALNHAVFHVNVPHFAVILGVLGVVGIVIGGWASVQELRGVPSKSAAAPAPAPVAYGAAPANAPTSPTAGAAENPVSAPVVAGPDDPTIQS